MTKMKLHTFPAALAIILGMLAFVPAQARADSAAQINADARAALNNLYDTNPKARALGDKAYAVLVFPNILKGGFVFAGEFGEGALITPNATEGYYAISAASFGFQAGIQGFSYALFFMNQKSTAYLHGRGGWELGTAPSLVIVDEGISKSISTTNIDKDIYTFVYNQKGLMGALGIQGSKITQIHPR